jgi:hypothetical protein
MDGLTTRPVAIRYEQAVYGSFPFWDRGYAVLAQSPGCRPEWLAGLRAACQRFGERPGGVAEDAVRGLFALRLESGPWMIVGVGSPGSDDRGRPGALAFHALFLSPREYRRAGCNPFALAGSLRNDWDADTRSLPAGVWTIATGETADLLDDPRAASIAAALARGRRVALEASAPIDTLARQVWALLPDRVRRRTSVATWAFANGNRFDLVALPRLATSGADLDASYLEPSALGGAEMPSARPRGVARGKRLGHALPVVAGVSALLLGALSGLFWQRDRGQADARARPDTPAPADIRPAPEKSPPDRASYRDDPDPADPDERRRVAEALDDLAERFGVVAASSASSTVPEEGPTAPMVLLAERLRYRGPWLSPAELAELSTAREHNATLALRWHALLRRFADDRPLPRDFARGPLRWQLDTLAWSFHLDPDPGPVAGDDPPRARHSPAELLHALGEALAVDVPLPPPPAPLSARHPALAAYRDFLGRLPRR